MCTAVVMLTAHILYRMSDERRAHNTRIHARLYERISHAVSTANFIWTLIQLRYFQFYTLFENTEKVSSTFFMQSVSLKLPHDFFLISFLLMLLLIELTVSMALYQYDVHATYFV